MHNFYLVYIGLFCFRRVNVIYLTLFSRIQLQRLLRFRSWNKKLILSCSFHIFTIRTITNRCFLSISNIFTKNQEQYLWPLFGSRSNDKYKNEFHRKDSILNVPIIAPDACVLIFTFKYWFLSFQATVIIAINTTVILVTNWSDLTSYNLSYSICYIKWIKHQK